MTERPIARYQGAIVFVQDIVVATRFYTQTLGLEIEIDFGENVGLRGGLALWQLGPERIIRQHLGTDAIADQRANRFELYFEAEDVAVVRERVLASGAELLHEIHEEPWGQRTLRFFDPDRHLIEVGEQMVMVVKRLQGDGMTLEQVSRKTAMPLEQVRALLAA